MGCGETLFVGLGGHVTCGLLGCPDPTIVDDLLHDRLAGEHVVTFDESGFSVQHPLYERGEDLVACGLHQHVRALDGPPVAPGRYVARPIDGRWSWSELPAQGEVPG